MKIETLYNAITQYIPEAWPILRADLAVIGTLCFSDQILPIALIHVGPSSSLKTEVINMFFPDENHQPALSEVFYRSDNFTPASFVTHAANIKAAQLAELDLLPKIRNRVLLTKELSPIFTGHRDDLLRTFAVLTSVLDGQGYVSSSGVRGTRGYPQPIVFNWIGATKPFRSDIHAILSALGPRLYFFNVATKPKSESELFEYAKKENLTMIRAHCRRAVQDFLVDFFNQNPKACRRSEDVIVPEHLLKRLVLLTMAMARLRAGFSLREADEDSEGNGEERYGAPDKENEHRAIQIFKMLARGSALVHGRDTVNEDDLMTLSRIAFSSCPEPRRMVFEAVMVRDGEATTSQIAERTGMSKPTSLHYLKELNHVGLVELDRGLKEWAITIKEPFDQLIREMDEGPEADKTMNELGDWFEAQA